MNFPAIKSQRTVLWVIVSLFLLTGLFSVSYVGYLYDQKTELGAQVAEPLVVIPEYLVTSVIDGDTFDILVNEERQTVRLIAVDAPESRHPTKPVQCFSTEAKKYLKELIENKYVTLDKEILDSDKDRYGRLLRYAFINGKNINELLLRNGYALEKSYVKGYKYQSTFKKAQFYAQTQKSGLWGESTCGGNVNFNTYLDMKGPELKYTHGCDCTKSCSSIKTCKEAIFQFEVCNCAGRDLDGDGVPCSNLCK